MRAVVDDPSLASLAGAPSGRIAGYAWMLGVMFAALAGILLSPTLPGMNQLQLTSWSSTGTRRRWWGGCAACP